MKLQISFPAGVYSQNKENIKKVFSILDYKYKSGNKISENKLICIWQRQPEKQIIKAIFNGSGKECQFIIECNDDELKVFKSFEKIYKVNVEEYKENEDKFELVKIQAKKNVDKWFTWQKPYRKEPPLFYQKRIEKMNQSYDWFVNREYERLKQLI